MDKICKNCGSTEFFKFDGHYECAYCGEIWDGQSRAISIPAIPSNEMEEENNQIQVCTVGQECPVDFDEFEDEEVSGEEVDSLSDDDEESLDEDYTMDSDATPEFEVCTIDSEANPETEEGLRALLIEDIADWDTKSEEDSPKDTQEDFLEGFEQDEDEDVEDEPLTADGQEAVVSEDAALSCFMAGELAAGYEIMDKVSDFDDGPYKNLTYYYIGKCFETGQGVAAEADRARYFYNLAENNEQVGTEYEIGETCYLLAMMYLKGEFFAKNEQKAFALFEAAAKFNHPKALYNCGLCCRFGEGTVLNEARAFVFFLEAAKLGHGKAYFQMGKAYEEGIGLPQNIEKAVEAYKIAAKKGVALAMGALGNVYYYGLLGGMDFGEAFYWYEKGEALGDSICRYNLAQCYYKGVGCTANIQKALDLLFKEIDLGNQAARALAREIRDKYNLSL